MPTVRYSVYDVFTDASSESPRTGNPLAVVIEPPELTTPQCAAVARELGLSETVFVRVVGGSVTARIFTPTAELPFAGHPTIGAAMAVHEEGLVGARVVVTVGVGPVEVLVRDGMATLTTPGAPTSVEVADPEDIAQTLGIDFADLHPALGPRGWSVGVPFTMVAVRDLDVLARCQVDLHRWQHTMAETAAPDLYVLAPLEGVNGRRWRTRMFGPGLGMAEDPATGSAAAAAVGYLAGVVPASRLEAGWLFTQGVELGRPSLIHVGALLRGAELLSVTVGGSAARAGHGELHI